MKNTLENRSPFPARKKEEFTKLPTYSLAERDRRWQLGRQFMDEHGLRALIIYGDREGSFPAPFAIDTYFTNDRPGAIVVFPRDAEPISLVAFPMAVVDQMQARLRNESVWIRPENVFAGKKGAAVVDVLKKHGLTRGSVGVIGLETYPPYYFEGPIPYNTWKTVIDSFPETTFLPVQKQFFELTAARSNEELEVLKWCGKVGERMCEAMLDATRPGVSEGEIYAAVTDACPKEAGFTGMILLGSGHEYFAWGPPSWIYRPHAPRIIEEGDVVLAEVFCSFGMLETQHQPTIAVGRVHPDFEKAAAVARRSYEVGLKELRPGRPFKKVVEAMEAPVREAGGRHVHPWIQSMNPFGIISGVDGLSNVPGADHYGRVGHIPMVGGDVEIQSGMTFACEPNCAIGRHLVNLGGTVVVGDHGPLELNHISAHLMRAA